MHAARGVGGKVAELRLLLHSPGLVLLEEVEGGVGVRDVLVRVVGPDVEGVAELGDALLAGALFVAGEEGWCRDGVRVGGEALPGLLEAVAFAGECYLGAAGFPLVAV